MKTIKILKEEHQNILRLADILEIMAVKLTKGEDVDDGDLKLAIDLIQNYADKHHHGKEELILFKYLENLEDAPQFIPAVTGMRIDHDSGRAFRTLMTLNLDDYKSDYKARAEIISALIAYKNMIKDHINREDKVLFSAAERMLTADLIKEIDEKTQEFEDEAYDLNTQDWAIKSIKDLEERYYE